MGRFDNRRTRKIRQRRAQSSMKARFKTASAQHRPTHARAKLDSQTPLQPREIRKTGTLAEILGVTNAEGAEGGAEGASTGA